MSRSQVESKTVWSMGPVGRTSTWIAFMRPWESLRAMAVMTFFVASRSTPVSMPMMPKSIHSMPSKFPFPSLVEHLLHPVLRDEVGEVFALVLRYLLEHAVLLETRPAREVHRQHERCAVLLEGARGLDTLARHVVAVEAGEVAHLDGEVHLVFGRALQLVEELLERNLRRARVDELVGGEQAAHEQDVFCDDLGDAWPHDLDRDLIARLLEDGAMHLRDGRRAQRMLVEHGEHVCVRVDRLDDGVEIDRLDICAQLAELVAVLLGQYVGVRGGDLPELDERRAELLQDGDCLLGRQPLRRHLVLADDPENLAHALRARLVLDGQAGQLDGFLERRHACITPES